MLTKKIYLDFVDESHKEDYLKFKTIPFKEYTELARESNQLQDQDDAIKGISSLEFIEVQVSKHFIEGQITEDGETIAITPENILDKLPADVLIEAFSRLMGKTSPNS